MQDHRERTGIDQANLIDRSRVQGEIAKLGEARTRRSFLLNAAAAGTSATVLGVAATGHAASGSSAATALPYQNDPNWVKSHFQDIINNETQHLQGLLNELGVYARPMPSFVNISVTTLTQYIQIGSLFCSTGAGAYLGASPYISNPTLLTQAGSLGQVELAQSAYLNTLLDQPFLPGGSPFAVPLTLDQVLQRAAPYVSSLNGGPEPTFSTTDKSFQNDVNILNVALILEYLEVAFYTGNFSKIFPS